MRRSQRSIPEHDFAPPQPAGRRARLGRKKAAIGLASILTLTALAIPANALAIGTAPSLGTADPFGVLAASTVTNTGPSTVGGDLGLYPQTSIIGFPPGNILGTEHDADAVAQQAQSDTTTAYNQAAGEAPDVVLPSNDLTGLTLTPGVYENASAVMLDTDGTLTLNGQGNPDSVFIFQVGSTLTTGTNSTISYINGAQPCNVFWQVGSSATLGTSSLFVGTILADQSISVSDTVTVDGRLLASTGAVTLIDDTITPSQCAPPVTNPTPTTPVTTPAPTTPVAAPTPTPTTAPATGGSTGTTKGGGGSTGTTKGGGGSTGTTSGGSTGTTKTGLPISAKAKAAAKQHKARVAKQHKARVAKQRKARLAKQHKARLARERKARLAKLHARQQAPKHPIHHAGFTG